MGYRAFTAVATLLLLASCEKIRYFSNVNVDMPYSKEFVSPAFDSGFHVPVEGMSYSLPILAVATGSLASINKMGLDTGQVIAIKLRSFSQKVSSGHHCNFDFVDSLQVYISAVGLPEILMTDQNSIPNDADSISFHCSEQNLKDYLLKDTVYLRLQGHFNGVPEPATFKTNFKFGTTARLLK
ncbi:hypothetical protein [Polluticoccus soli]|uniref:hypothetical protein n=1 Tax=Polluticoccus soli TaxID=3034150 RepID=UPI0023E135FA|nr:hypothetical protein [Flavipsychrobacter sp. JY13-12]